MTPKEKAKDLLDKMERQTYKYQEYAGAIYKTCEIGYEGGKKCALIAVEEILNARPLDPNYVDWDDCGAAHQYWYEAQKEEALEFWNDVKSELQSL
jgi:hypothetical protein